MSVQFDSLMEYDACAVDARVVYSLVVVSVELTWTWIIMGWRN